MRYFESHLLRGERLNHRRRIKTEKKEKVVAAAWGTELIQFVAAITVLYQDSLKNRINSTSTIWRIGWIPRSRLIWGIRWIHPIFKSFFSSVFILLPWVELSYQTLLNGLILGAHASWRPERHCLFFYNDSIYFIGISSAFYKIYFQVNSCIFLLKMM